MLRGVRRLKCIHPTVAVAAAAAASQRRHQPKGSIQRGAAAPPAPPAQLRSAFAMAQQGHLPLLLLLVVVVGRACACASPIPSSCCQGEEAAGVWQGDGLIDSAGVSR